MQQVWELNEKETVNARKASIFKRPRRNGLALFDSYSVYFFYKGSSVPLITQGMFATLVSIGELPNQGQSDTCHHCSW